MFSAPLKSNTNEGDDIELGLLSQTNNTPISPTLILEMINRSVTNITLFLAQIEQPVRPRSYMNGAQSICYLITAMISVSSLMLAAGYGATQTFDTTFYLFLATGILGLGTLVKPSLSNCRQSSSISDRDRHCLLSILLTSLRSEAEKILTTVKSHTKEDSEFNDANIEELKQLLKLTELEPSKVALELQLILTLLQKQQNYLTRNSTVTELQLPSFISDLIDIKVHFQSLKQTIPTFFTSKQPITKEDNAAGVGSAFNFNTN